jgi:hypothetical protein
LTNIDTPRASGIVGRFLASWLFWPAYLGVVLLVLCTMRPWEKWYAGKGDISGGMYGSGITILESTGLEGITLTVGSVVLMPEATDSPGQDWLACDGASVPTSEYPDLAAIIGNRFGDASERLTLPDYRGLEAPTRPGYSMSVRLAHEPPRYSMVTMQSIRFWIKAKP